MALCDASEHTQLSYDVSTRSAEEETLESLRLDHQYPQEASQLRATSRGKISAQQKRRFFRLLRVLAAHPAYQAYRAKQADGAAPPRKTKKGDQCTWPDHQELAFMLALSIIPPMGRLKLQLSEMEKAEGRNEIIARMIKTTPGSTLARDSESARKQVSSHIQVLKGKLKRVPEFMARLEVPPKPSRRVLQESSSHRHHYDQLSVDADLLGALSLGPTSEHMDGPSEGVFPNSYLAPIVSTRAPTMRLSTYTIWISGPPGSSELLASPTTSLSPDDQQPDLDLSAVDAWRERFPRLDTISPTGSFGCQVMLVSVNCRLKRHIDAASEKLGVRLSFSINHTGDARHSTGIDNKHDIHHDITYNCATYVSSPYGSTEFQKELPQQQGHGEILLNGDDSNFKDEIAREMINVLQRADEVAQTRGESSAADLSEAEFQEVLDSALSSFTVVQQISACHAAANTSGERLGLVLWEFRSVGPDQEPYTTWRSVAPTPQTVLGSSRQPFNEVAIPFEFSDVGVSSGLPLSSTLQPAFAVNADYCDPVLKEEQQQDERLGSILPPLGDPMPFSELPQQTLQPQNMTFKSYHALDGTAPSLVSSNQSRSQSSIGSSNALPLYNSHYDAMSWQSGVQPYGAADIAIGHEAGMSLDQGTPGDYEQENIGLPLGMEVPEMAHSFDLQPAIGVPCGSSWPDVPDWYHQTAPHEFAPGVLDECAGLQDPPYWDLQDELHPSRPYGPQ